MSLGSGLANRLQDAWWRPRPSGLARLLQPLSWLYAGLAAWQRRQARSAARRLPPLPVPVLVVGNLVVGGAGKTPTTIALIHALKQAGWSPGVLSRGYGRRTSAPVEVTRETWADQCGDEPLLIHLRTGAPVQVDRDRVAAAWALLRRRPDVDVLVADDGLQHHRLSRDGALVVLDGRGLGNGLLLPAGPLRQRPPHPWPDDHLLLYNAATPSTPWPGPCAQRQLGVPVALAAWWRGEVGAADTLDRLVRASAQQPVWAAAGIAEPERFFLMLEGLGLQIRRLPLPDHAALDPSQWPALSGDVLLTEKDAVKLRPDAVPAPWRVWVLPLDFQLPPETIQRLQHLLKRRKTAHDR